MSFDVPKEFRVPDMITDITRSLEMVETSRLIYWTMLFGHRKCSGEFRIKPECGKGLPEPPGELMGLYGP